MVLDPYDFHRWGKWGVLPGTDNTPSTMKPTTELGRLPYPVHSNGRATTLKVVDSVDILPGTRFLQIPSGMSYFNGFCGKCGSCTRYRGSRVCYRIFAHYVQLC